MDSNSVVTMENFHFLLRLVNKIVSGYERVRTLEERKRFGQALDGHVCGSPQLVSRHQHAASSLLDVISDRQPKTVASADENSTTFLDLPRE
ncbi:hypothetical protein TELCIR_22056, partial [Teladorsagia circumcincta]